MLLEECEIHSIAKWARDWEQEECGEKQQRMYVWEWAGYLRSTRKISNCSMCSVHVILYMDQKADAEEGFARRSCHYLKKEKDLFYFCRSA